MCLSAWPLLYFYSTTGSWKISVCIKRTSTNVCIFLLIYLSACSVVQIFCNPLCRHGHQQWSSCTFCGQLLYKVTPSFAKMYLLSWYCEDLSISDLWLTLCLCAISHKESWNTELLPGYLEKKRQNPSLFLNLEAGFSPIFGSFYYH